MKFTAVGDMIIGRRIQADFEGYAELSPIIRQGDARFFNLETTLHREGECYAFEISGGTYLRADPEVLEDASRFGFNMVSFNNNHVMDFAHDGLLRTLENVEKSGLVHAGVGRNLGEASAPRYLETSAGRVALISINAALKPGMCAGEQTARIKGRPGVNPLRHKTHWELCPADFESVCRIIDKTGINAQRNIEKREGYHGGAGDLSSSIGDFRVLPGEVTRAVTTMNAIDLERTARAIYEAQLQADYILVSLHAHAMGGTEKEEPAEFVKEFAHFCIDRGAHAVIGHGPHLLRPIEIYRERPIFYSLGDFTLQLYNIPFAPTEFYEQYGMSATDTVHDLLKKRSKDFSIGLMTDHRMFETVIPLWEMEGGKLTSLVLYPVTLAMDGNRSGVGLPRLAKDSRFLADFIRRCAAYGTAVKEREDGALVCSRE